MNAENRTASTAARKFLSLGIQHWGQSAEKREEATDDYLRAAGFDLDQDRATAALWLQDVLAKMPRGKFEHEADHLRAAIEARLTGAVGDREGDATPQTVA